MTELGAPGAPVAGASAPALPAGEVHSSPDQRSLQLNNTLQFLSSAAWYIATPFVPLYLISHGAESMRKVLSAAKSNQGKEEEKPRRR
jgi:hypothetical protein